MEILESAVININNAGKFIGVGSAAISFLETAQGQIKTVIKNLPRIAGQGGVMDAIEELKMIKYGVNTSHLRDAILALAERVEALDGEIYGEDATDQSLAQRIGVLERDMLKLRYPDLNDDNESPAASGEWPELSYKRDGVLYHIYWYDEKVQTLCPINGMTPPFVLLIMHYNKLLAAHNKLRGENKPLAKYGKEDSDGRD
jgi:hypothetical protein